MKGAHNYDWECSTGTTMMNCDLKNKKEEKLEKRIRNQ